MRTRIIVTVLSVLLPLLFLWYVPLALAEEQVDSQDVAITAIRFYAWYLDSEDEVRYQEVKSFPVSDDSNEYPMFDVVVTVKNKGSDSIAGASLKTTLTYQVGPVNKDDAKLSPEETYEIAKKQAVWQKPTWVKRTTVPLLAPGQSYPIRVGCIVLDDVTRQFWKHNQWPYHARVVAFVSSVKGEHSLADNRMQKEIAIDMLD